MNKDTKNFIKIIAIVIIIIDIIIAFMIYLYYKKKKFIESFNNPKSSNNISLDDIQRKLDELQGGN